MADSHGAGEIVVTGLTGFVGQRLQVPLLESFPQVRALIRRPRKTTGLDPRVVSDEISLADPTALARALKEASHVIHLAGSVRGSGPEDFRAANIDAVEYLCEAIRAQPVKPSLLLVSSIVAREPELSDYSASKFAGEEILRSCNDFSWTIFRPPAIYGPGDTEMMPLLKLMRRGITLVPGNPEQRLGFLQVDDLVSAILHWIRFHEECRWQCFEIDDGMEGGYDWQAVTSSINRSGGRVFVIPAGLLRRVGAFNRRLARLFSYAPMLTPGKVRELTHDCWAGDDREFSALTGWHPRYNLAEGVEALFAGR